MTEKSEPLVKLAELPVVEIVDDLIQVYKEYMVIRAALKLQLFDWIAEHGPASPEEISAGTGILQKYVSALIGMLYYLDLVRKSGDGRYILSPSANLHFVTSSRYYQGNFILNSSSPDAIWQEMDTILTGSEGTIPTDPVDPEFVKAQAEISIRGTVQNVMKSLHMWKEFSAARSFLEIDGGHGLYAVAACQMNPDIRAMVHRSPESDSALQDYIHRFGMEGQVSAYQGDIVLEKPVKQFDIVLVSHFLYPFIDDLTGILKNIISSVKEGGLLITNHWFDRPHEGTGMQGLYELELAVHNRNHLLDKEEFEKVCTGNGLTFAQSGVFRSTYGECTIHMFTKKI